MEGFESAHKKKIDRRTFLSGAAAVGAGAFGAKLGLDTGVDVSGIYEENFARLEKFRENIPEGLPVTVTIDSEGRFVFRHEDENTTEVVDFLSGRGPVTDKLIARNMRKAMFTLMKGAGVDMSVPENRDLLYQTDTAEEIIALYDKYYYLVPEEKKEGFQDSFTYALSRIEEERVRDESIREQIKPEMYQELWQLFIDCGAPRVELVDSYEERTKGRDMSYASSDRFVFNGDNGGPLVYIDDAYKSDMMLNLFLQELAHSYSFYTDPDGFNKRTQAKKEYGAISKDYTPEERAKGNSKFYREEGNEEYYAHQVVYPKLVSRIAKYHPTINEYLEYELERLQND